MDFLGLTKPYRGVCGVYRFRLKLGGPVYVGRSEDVGHRLMGHIYLLKKGTHYNCRMQSDFNDSYFDLELVKPCTTDQLEEFEWNLIVESQNLGLYNNPKQGSKVGAFSKDVSAETRLKLGERQQGCKNHFFGKRHSPETLAMMREARAALPKFKCELCEYVGLASSLALHKKSKHAAIEKSKR